MPFKNRRLAGGLVRQANSWIVNLTGISIVVSTGRPPFIAGLNLQFLTAFNAALSSRSNPLVWMIIAWVVVPVIDISNRTLTTPLHPIVLRHSDKLVAHF